MYLAAESREGRQVWKYHVKSSYQLGEGFMCLAISGTALMERFYVAGSFEAASEKLDVKQYWSIVRTDCHSSGFAGQEGSRFVKGHLGVAVSGLVHVVQLAFVSSASGKAALPTAAAPSNVCRAWPYLLLLGPGTIKWRLRCIPSLSSDCGVGMPSTFPGVSLSGISQQVY